MYTELPESISLHHFLHLRWFLILNSGFFVAKYELRCFFFISLLIDDRLT